MKRRIRLTESDLHRIVRRSVNKILRESDNNGNTYEGGISYFIDSVSDHKNSIQVKDNLLDILDTIPEIEVQDVCDDGEDWCIDCAVTVSCNSIKEAGKIITKLANEGDVTWDYHYIKGLDNNEYWQP